MRDVYSIWNNNQQEERDMHVENEALYYLQWTDDTKFIDFVDTASTHIWKLQWFSEQANREDKKIKKLLSDTNPFVLLCRNTTQHNTTQQKQKQKQNKKEAQEL